MDKVNPRLELRRGASLSSKDYELGVVVCSKSFTSTNEVINVLQQEINAQGRGLKMTRMQLQIWMNGLHLYYLHLPRLIVVSSLKESENVSWIEAIPIPDAFKIIEQFCTVDCEIFDWPWLNFRKSNFCNIY